MHQRGHKETSVHPSSLRARDNKILGIQIINASLRPKSQPSGPRYKHITFSSTAVPHSMPPPSGQNACSQRPNTHHVVPPVPLKWIRVRPARPRHTISTSHVLHLCPERGAHLANIPTCHQHFVILTTIIKLTTPPGTNLCPCPSRRTTLTPIHKAHIHHAPPSAAISH